MIGIDDQVVELTGADKEATEKICWYWTKVIENPEKRSIYCNSRSKSAT
jgi:hypothetical protein